MWGTGESTILGRRDVAALPYVCAAAAGLAIGARTIVGGDDGGAYVPIMVLSGIWLAGGALGAALILGSRSKGLLTRPARHIWAGLLAGASLAAAIMYDGGLESPYVGGLILGAVYFGLVLPTQMSVAVAAVIGGLVLAVQVAVPADEPAVFLGVLMMVPVAWWNGSVGHRAHEGAARAALLLSRADRLTVSLNRRGLLEVFRRDLHQAELAEQPLSVLLLDLDDFKPINDEHGHAAGDEILRWVGEQVGHVAGPLDQFGRLGGDEFALVLPDATAVHASHMAQVVRDALRPQIGVSVGAATFPEDGRAPEVLLRVADARMYAAKGGRDRRCVR